MVFFCFLDLRYISRNSHPETPGEVSDNRGQSCTGISWSTKVVDPDMIHHKPLLWERPNHLHRSRRGRPSSAARL